MKKMIRLMTCAVVATMSMETAKANINIPSNGSDGALVITENTVIDLGQAITGNWDTNNNANAGKGVYDAAKWAVVFKYSSVVVQGGTTVTFKNHGSRAPVVWLVSGDVTINGTVSLDGQGGIPAPGLAEPGPGGFRAGSGNYAPGAGASAGFGPGGGGIYGVSYYGDIRRGGGSYGSASYRGLPPYGNPSLIPLVGGSGGAGSLYDANTVNGGGGAGGGAILIASGGSLAISGLIRANGGATGPSVAGSGGSGGGIRLVADTLAGSGIVQAFGGATPGTYPNGLGWSTIGTPGRIRIERVLNANDLQLTPDPSVVTLASGATPQIWLPTNGPTTRIVSIGGVDAPADPRAGFGSIGADTILPRVTNTTVVVETTNVELASIVTVRATPRSNGDFFEVTANPILPVISEDPLVIRWTANVPVQDGYSAVQVKVVRP